MACIGNKSSADCFQEGFIIESILNEPVSHDQMQDSDIAIMENLTSQTMENDIISSGVPGSIIEEQDGATQAQVLLI